MFRLFVTITLAAIAAVLAQEECLMQTCCEYDCCGPGTVWVPETGDCKLDFGNEGFVRHDNDFELECRKQTCCEDACCGAGLTYNGDCCQDSNAPVFIVKASFELGPVQNCPLGLIDTGTLVFNSQFGIDHMTFPMGDCDEPVEFDGIGFFCPDTLLDVIAGFTNVAPGPDDATLTTSFRFINVTDTLDFRLCEYELTVTYEILCGVVNFSALPEGCNVADKETPTCVCQLNCIGDDCVAPLRLQVDNAVQSVDFGLCTAPGFMEKMGMDFGTGP